MPDCVRQAALGDACRPLNPHAQRLQVAAHKQVRQLALPKGKAKGKAKAKAKTKCKASPKGKPKAKAKSKATGGSGGGGAKSKTIYGKAKGEYLDWLLGCTYYEDSYHASED